MGEWGRRPGLRPIHAVSPAAACSPASSTSFYHHHHHHYCYRRRYRYRHHHPTSALAYLVTPSLPFTRHTHARARIPHATSVFLPLPFFLFFFHCLDHLLLFFFSLSRCYSQDSFSRLISSFSIFLLFLIKRARARTHTHSYSLALFFSRSFSFFAFLCLARTRSSFMSYEKDSKPNTQQFIIIYYPYFSPLYLIHMCLYRSSENAM